MLFSSDWGSFDAITEVTGYDYTAGGAALTQTLHLASTLWSYHKETELRSIISRYCKSQLHREPRFFETNWEGKNLFYNMVE